MNILGAAVVVLMLFLINTFLQNIITDTSVLVMVYSVALSLCFAFLVFAIFAFSDGLQKEVEILRKKEELQNLQGYTQHIEEMVAGLRGFRHDHEYLMAGFYNYIREKDIANIEEYFNKYMRAFREDAASADSQLDRLKLIKVPPLKSILSYKLLQARGLGIQVYVDVLDPIENIEDDDLIGVCRMMGIILSNAIEGCQDEKQPMLGFMATVNGNNIFLVTENTCTTNMSLAEIFKSKFTTKESGRGVGLSNASQLIDANGNLKLETHLQDGTFLQSLSISTASPASP
ncbi:MAG: GHKL domain-containing protein [Defluviitaleaceae bacterium]|nr:GHKL domain-containing protein [Defluviitaleaceae bacterium]